MAEIRGRLRVRAGESSVKGKTLATCGSENPFGDATDFLAGLGLGDGDNVIVTGEAGAVGTEDVFCVTDARLATMAAAASAKKAPAKKAAAKKAEKKRAAKKRAVKKPAARKRAAKRSAKKR